MCGTVLPRLLCSLMLILPLKALAEDSHFLLAVKVYKLEEAKVESTISQWGRLDINAVFAPVSLLETHPTLRRRLSQEGISLFLIVPVYYDPESVLAHPELRAIRGDGTPAKTDWVEFVCPTHPEYRQRRIQEIVALSQRYAPEFISLDFIRHFAFWEMNHPETPPRELESTCTCPGCVSLFQDSLNLRRVVLAPKDVFLWLYREGLLKHWQRWRIELINRMARDIVTAVKTRYPGTKFNLHLVPWRSQDYDNAALNIVGQDAAALGEIVDTISPMCYSFMLKRPSPWIHEFVSWLAERVHIPILTSIQVAKAYGEAEPSISQFAAALEAAGRPPSSGIVFWNWEMLCRDPKKLELVKKAAVR